MLHAKSSGRQPQRLRFGLGLGLGLLEDDECFLEEEVFVPDEKCFFPPVVEVFLVVVALAVGEPVAGGAAAFEPVSAGTVTVFSTTTVLTMVAAEAAGAVFSLFPEKATTMAAAMAIPATATPAPTYRGIFDFFSSGFSAIS